ncbi:LAFE_0D07492g1_1 [Lachancea fermentati]|uniref:Pre-rRNA-processing protein n=1 Tax=Lachancea fermentati TaxID=4955 RepID=A0A1G4MBR0_LACFM|nr:LAFE_0D07492g1_1 [Lachancea fermentati]
MAKKKTLKQQDFQKKKLKVGKAKAKPSNLTDTSFVARTISLPNQSKINTNNSGTRDSTRTEEEVLKRISLCRHHSAVTRKETLVYFKQIIPKVINSKCITQMLSGCFPLICDEDMHVRIALLELLEEIGEHDENVLKLHSRAFVLFINSGMTHITPSVQRDSGKFLNCAIKYCGDEIVRSAWIKILRGMFGVLGWSLEKKSSKKTVSMGINSASVVNMNSSKAQKARDINLEALLNFVKCGCLEETTENASVNDDNQFIFDKYMLPEFSQPYQHLKLFTKEFISGSTIKGSPVTSTSTLETLSGISFQDYPARRKVLIEHFYEKIMEHLQSLIADGGECGKKANAFKGTLERIRLVDLEA